MDKKFYVKVHGVIDGVTYFVTNANGILSKTASDAEVFEINPGTPLKIENLPVGQYTVTEVSADGSAISASSAPGDMGSMTVADFADIIAKQVSEQISQW